MHKSPTTTTTTTPDQVIDQQLDEQPTPSVSSKHVLTDVIEHGLSELNGATPIVVPDNLIADFDKVVTASEVDTNDDGVADHILLGDPDVDQDQVDFSAANSNLNLVPIADWNNGNFNMLDQSIRRDNTHQVTTNEELIGAFNNHSFSGSRLGKISGVATTVLSLGMYNLVRRRVVPPGFFGHYISTERHKLVPAGVHSLGSTTSKWRPNILIDDEANPNRKFGDKVILQVPENHLAGGYRIGTHGSKSNDQEFVLFSQGRHVLPESKYYGVTIVKLDKTKLKLGPLTVLYVREGWIGGCIRRKTGTYKLLYPGPPYVLHEAEFESIELVKRTDDVFMLGPYQFVCVKSGRLAGAYSKADGVFQILPPGHSYKLHSKDFQPVEQAVRQIQFKLGPYFYITVKDNFVAGVFVRKTGLFRRLKPGKTYRLNRDTFMEPVQECRNTHITVCGPLTVLTVEEGTLNGAYRVEDGVFVEFEDMDTEFILHKKMYYGLTTVPKYSSELQTFGPYKVITIREGFVGQFECEGKIEIKQPGFYKVNSAYHIYESIPVKMFQEVLNELNFRAKDGVQMSAKASITWNVSDPMLVAKFAGSFTKLRDLVIERSKDTIVRMCKMNNRGDLLPTKQDVERVSDLDEQLTSKQMNDLADERALTLVATLVESCEDGLNEISATSKLGITVVKVQIDRFTLKNLQILQDLEDITIAELAAKAEKVRGKLEIARAEAGRLTRMKQAEADAAVRRTEVATECETRVKENEADNKIQASVEAMSVKVATDKMVKEAEAKAKAIHAITEAEFNKAVKEREAAAAMAPCELELKRLELQVNMLKEIGHAAWKYPDVYSGFLDQFGSSLRFGPMTADESLAKAVNNNNTITTNTKNNLTTLGLNTLKIGGNIKSIKKTSSITNTEVSV